MAGKSNNLYVNLKRRCTTGIPDDITVFRNSKDYKPLELINKYFRDLYRREIIKLSTSEKTVPLTRHTPVMPACVVQRQEGLEFEVSLGSRARPRLQKIKGWGYSPAVECLPRDARPWVHPPALQNRKKKKTNSSFMVKDETQKTAIDTCVQYYTENTNRPKDRSQKQWQKWKYRIAKEILTLTLCSESRIAHTEFNL
jgi:hypothetical protein